MFDSFSGLIKDAIGWEGLPWWLIPLVLFVSLSFLNLVRKIEKFAWTHTLADIMIMITLMTCCAYGASNIVENGASIGPFINTQDYVSAIGFSIFAFEGIGLVMPVQDITANKKGYPRVLLCVVIAVAALYICVGVITLFSYGDGLNFVGPPDDKSTDKAQIILQQLPLNWYTWTVKMLFCLNLIFSYPLALYPVHSVIENILYKGWPKSPKR